MPTRHRTAALATAVAALLSAGCWSDVKEPQSDDSVGAYEPAAGADSGVPTGGPLPTPVDTGDTSGAGGTGIPPASARDTTTPPPQL